MVLQASSYFLLYVKKTKNQVDFFTHMNYNPKRELFKSSNVYADFIANSALVFFHCAVFPGDMTVYISQPVCVIVPNHSSFLTSWILFWIAVFAAIIYTTPFVIRFISTLKMRYIRKKRLRIQFMRNLREHKHLTIRKTKKRADLTKSIVKSAPKTLWI